MCNFSVWLTGLPSSGKTTLGRLLHSELQKYRLSAVLLDGDDVRKTLSRDLGYSKPDRDENVRRIIQTARLINASQGIAVVCCISPYRASREQARQELGRFVEVYLRCPLEVCISRDTKGLYKKALSREISNFTGISDPYEEPLNPEVIVETDRETPEEGVRKILAYLKESGYLDGALPPPPQGDE